LHSVPPFTTLVFGTLRQAQGSLRLRVWFPTIPVLRNRTRSLAEFSESVAEFPSLLPRISFQFPCSFERDPMEFHFSAEICFVVIIADDFSASSCPINRTGRKVSCLDDPVSNFLLLLQA
jgi:hypothetical protein